MNLSELRRDIEQAQEDGYHHQPGNDVQLLLVAVAETAEQYAATGCGGNAPCGYDELAAMERAVDAVRKTSY